MGGIFQNVVYVRIQRRLLSVRVLSWAGGDSSWQGEPVVDAALDRHGNMTDLLIAGMEPPKTAVARTSHRLFDHPRVLLGSPDLFCVALPVICRAAGLRKSLSKPLFVVQIQERLEGGVSELERRALREACERAGCGRTIIIESPEELHPPELLALARGKGDAVQGFAT